MENGTVIANPIYDAVFKNLMSIDGGTNKDIAGYFIGAILGEEIADVDFLPQEYPVKKTKRTKNNKREATATVRMDFVATIRTKTGESKKVLIEIQKTNKPTDLERFRMYIGRQYQQIDGIKIKDGMVEETLPIVVIYLLGFNLPEIDTVAFMVPRLYIDLICDGEIKKRNLFVESLTHDGYFIQIARIRREMYRDWGKCNELLKMLSVFEQDYFIDETTTTKKYPYLTNDKNLSAMIARLEFIAADSYMQRVMLEEYWAARNEEIWEMEIAEKDAKIAELERRLGINGAH